MKRKIVQHGSSSLTLTLPVKWVQKYGVKKGDELVVEESGSTLVVSTGNQVYSSKKEIKDSEHGIFTKNDLSHLYQLGYDDIEIKYSDTKTLDEIKSRIPECIGFEIIDQKEGRAYIKCIATTIESEFDNLLRKAFLITNEMAKSIMLILESRHYEKLKEVRHMESLNNKFTDICIRILNKKGYKIQSRTMQAYEVVKNIERIADEYKYICDLLSGNGTVTGSKGGVKLGKDTVALYSDVIEYYLMFYEIFYRFDPVLKQRLIENRKKLLDRCYKKLLSSTGQEAIFAHHLCNIVEKTYEGCGGYFSLIL
jgi:phosphate uptake regulator